MRTGLLADQHSSPVVTVVVPTYNGQRFVADTLKSVLAQTQPSVELIVVDDGSTDSTCDVVRSVAPAAQLHTKRNGGVSAARNLGLAKARGRFVIFLDQDDIWHPDMLRLQVQWLDEHPSHAVAVCRYHHWFPREDGQYPSAEATWPPRVELAVDPDFTGAVYHQFLMDCWALTSGTLIRREALLACGGFDETLPYSEDWELWLRLSRTHQFALLQWPPVLYRQHLVQGSRVPRSRDYRTELLLRYAASYGLESADGRAIAERLFKRQVAAYRFEFGYHHLAHGSRWTGVRAVLGAWWLNPKRVKALAVAGAALVGWRPVQQ